MVFSIDMLVITGFVTLSIPWPSVVSVVSGESKWLLILRGGAQAAVHHEAQARAAPEKDTRCLW